MDSKLHNVDIRMASTTTTTYRCELSAADLKRALGLPDDAVISVEVPGGGDWSGVMLNVGTEEEMCDSPLIVRWTTVEESEL